jgi:hypothetical protein
MRRAAAPRDNVYKLAAVKKLTSLGYQDPHICVDRRETGDCDGCKRCRTTPHDLARVFSSDIAPG